MTDGDSSDLPDIRLLTPAQLLRTYGAVLDELRRRKIVRSSNNPLSDYAELLFCEAFGWTQKGNSESGYDAIDAQGNRYQVKGRRLTRFNGSRQLSAIRKLDTKPFDYLAGLLVDERFTVLRAVIIPLSIVEARSTHVAYTNSWKFMLVDDVWALPLARDVTGELRAAAAAI